MKLSHFVGVGGVCLFAISTEIFLSRGNFFRNQRTKGQVAFPSEEAEDEFLQTRTIRGGACRKLLIAEAQVSQNQPLNSNNEHLSMVYI